MYENIQYKTDIAANKRTKNKNDLDPELDLRNINFATGENQYLNQNNDEDCVSLEEI